MSPEKKKPDILQMKLPLKARLSYFDMPIRAKLAIAITLIILLTIIILSYIILSKQKESLYQHTVKMGKTSLNYFVNNARHPLVKESILELNTLINEAASVEGILYALIVDRKGVIKAHTDITMVGKPYQLLEKADSLNKEGDVTYFNYTNGSGSKVLNLSRPVAFKNVDLGMVHVGISLDFIEKQIHKESVFILVLSLFMVVIGIASAVLIGVQFARPISRLVIATKEVGKGNFQYRLDMTSRDEFGDLSNAFNYMTQELWRNSIMQKSFGRYVSPEVVDMIMSHPEESLLKGQRSEATILFSDIRGFTAYSADREPEEVVEALNEYFRIATGFILEYGGYVDKFIGDAVMGVFGVPVFRADHAERAVRAAVAMQKKFNTAGKNGNRLLNKIGIGINSGIIVSGNLGSDIKMEYTVIGDSVNLASRLSSVAGPGEIVISRSVYELTRVIITAEPIAPQKLKGKADLVESFKVTGLSDPPEKQQNRGLL
ncbi:MAG: adenylate cyclase [Thermodesulfobacteriota bacterium]|nr:adenylate cyclase [Thermodesulfobacteriota bacterium]